MRIAPDIAEALEHAVAVIVGVDQEVGRMTFTNPGAPPLNEQSGCPSASAVARKKKGRLSMNALSPP